MCSFVFFSFIFFFGCWCVVQSFASAFADSFWISLCKKWKEIAFIISTFCVLLLILSSQRWLWSKWLICLLMNAQRMHCGFRLEYISNKLHIFWGYHKWTAWARATMKLFNLILYRFFLNLFHTLSLSVNAKNVWANHSFRTAWFNDLKPKNFV